MAGEPPGVVEFLLPVQPAPDGVAAGEGEAAVLAFPGGCLGVAGLPGVLCRVPVEPEFVQQVIKQDFVCQCPGTEVQPAVRALVSAGILTCAGRSPSALTEVRDPAWLDRGAAEGEGPRRYVGPGQRGDVQEPDQFLFDGDRAQAGSHCRLAVESASAVLNSRMLLTVPIPVGRS